MCDLFPPDEQRKKLQRLSYYIRPKPIGLDCYGAPVINGRTGHIYATLDGFQVFVRSPSGQAWSWLKRKLLFAKVQLDGDDEGILTFKSHKLSLAQATMLADAIGI